MSGWEARHEGHIVTRPVERTDPAEAALVARLEAAGWTVVDRRAGEDVAVTDWPGLQWFEVQVEADTWAALDEFRTPSDHHEED